MLVLGIDPGSRATGYGLVDVNGGRMTAVDYGVIKPPPTKELAPRLKKIFESFSEIIENHKPDEVAVENIFFAKNARSSLLLGQARAAACLPGLLKNLPFYEYSALEVKKALAGSGRAEKSQVAEMVRRLLALKETPKPDDITDALAVAICHIHSSALLRRMAAG